MLCFILLGCMFVSLLWGGCRTSFRSEDAAEAKTLRRTQGAFGVGALSLLMEEALFEHGVH